MEKQDKYPHKQSGGRRTISVTLGLPTLLGSIAVLCAGFVFVFIMGLMLGSGYDIEARIPVLERMMPERPAGQPPRVISGNQEEAAATAEAPAEESAAPKKEEEGGAVAVSDKNASPSTTQTAQAQTGVMDQGQLAYRDRLKTGQGATASTAQAKDQKEDKKKKAEADKKKAEAEKEKEKKAAGQRFKYVYQAASYKDKASADRYAASLKADGLKARTEKSVENKVAWYRVMLDFTGTPDETDKLRATMRAKGVPKILMRSKEPVK